MGHWKELADEDSNSDSWNSNARVCTCFFLFVLVPQWSLRAVRFLLGKISSYHGGGNQHVNHTITTSLSTVPTERLYIVASPLPIKVHHGKFIIGARLDYITLLIEMNTIIVKPVKAQQHDP
jgi:hypothetical protein